MEKEKIKWIRMLSEGPTLYGGRVYLFCLAALIVAIVCFGYTIYFGRNQFLVSFPSFLKTSSGPFIIGVQVLLFVSTIRIVMTDMSNASDSPLIAHTPSICVALGITGTFLGFAFLFSNFSEQSPPYFSHGNDFTPILLALLTSLSGILLSSALESLLCKARGKVFRKKREERTARESNSLEAVRACLLNLSAEFGEGAMQKAGENLASCLRGLDTLSKLNISKSVRNANSNLNIITGKVKKSSEEIVQLTEKMEKANKALKDVRLDLVKEHLPTVIEDIESLNKDQHLKKAAEASSSLVELIGSIDAKDVQKTAKAFSALLAAGTDTATVMHKSYGDIQGQFQAIGTLYQSLIESTEIPAAVKTKACTTLGIHCTDYQRIKEDIDSLTQTAQSVAERVLHSLEKSSPQSVPTTHLANHFEKAAAELNAATAVLQSIATLSGSERTEEMLRFHKEATSFHTAVRSNGHGDSLLKLKDALSQVDKLNGSISHTTKDRLNTLSKAAEIFEQALLQHAEHLN